MNEQEKISERNNQALFEVHGARSNSFRGEFGKMSSVWDTSLQQNSGGSRKKRIFAAGKNTKIPFQKN